MTTEPTETKTCPTCAVPFEASIGKRGRPRIYCEKRKCRDAASRSGAARDAAEQRRTGAVTAVA